MNNHELLLLILWIVCLKLALILMVFGLAAIMAYRAWYTEREMLIVGKAVKGYLEMAESQHKDAASVVEEKVMPMAQETRQAVEQLKTEAATQEYTRDGTHRILDGLNKISLKLDRMMMRGNQ